MAQLIQSLNDEHRRMVKLLSLLEREIERFRSGHVLDYLLISSILDYLTGIGQYKLHLAEEEIFKCLKMRDPEGGEILSDIKLEHEKLTFLCDTLIVAVRNVEQDNELPRMWLVSVAIEFCTVMRSHIEVEDKHLFPLAARKLTSEDWELILLRIAEKGEERQEQMENEKLQDLRLEIYNWEREQPFI